MVSHANLAAALSELFTVLIQLCMFEPSDIEFPDPATGRYPKGHIDEAAAREVGLSPEAIDALYQLPYVDAYNSDILPWTGFARLAGDREVLRSLRSLDSGSSSYTKPWEIRLTQGIGAGYNLIYDTRTALLYPWDPSADKCDYTAKTPEIPSEFFAPWIERYRTLRFVVGIGMPDMTEEYQVPYPKDNKESSQVSWQIGQYTWEANQKIRDIYLECGWDINSKTQDSYRRDELLMKRKAHIEEVQQERIKQKQYLIALLQQESNMRSL